MISSLHGGSGRNGSVSCCGESIGSTTRLTGNVSFPSSLKNFKAMVSGLVAPPCYNKPGENESNN